MSVDFEFVRRCPMCDSHYSSRLFTRDVRRSEPGFLVVRSMFVCSSCGIKWEHRVHLRIAEVLENVVRIF